MKRLTIFNTILLAVFGALAVAGVLVFSLAVGNNGPNTAGPVNIWGTLDGGAISSVIQAVAETDPNFKQVTYEQKDQGSYESALTQALANGLGPDLFLMRQDYILEDAGKVVLVPPASISASQFQSTFIDAANPYYSQNGTIGIPVFVDPLVMYWNRDLLSSAGFARPPSYWDEFSKMAPIVTKKDDAGSITKSLIALGEYQNVTNAKDILTALILQAGGYITAIDSSGNLVPTLTSSGDQVQAAVNALSFYTKFADPSRPEYSWNRALPESRKAFAAGDVALYIGFASEGPLIAEMNPNLNFSAAPLPQVKNAAKAVDTAHVYALSITRTSQNPNGALAVAAGIATAQISKELSDRLGISSALRDVLSQPNEGNADLFNKQTIIARSWRDPNPERTADIFRGMIESVTSGASGPADAVQRANQEMAQALGL